MIHKSLQPKRSQLVAAMLTNGKPERLAIRHNAAFGGVVIEAADCLPIGGAFATLEAAHKAHSAAWRKAWERFESGFHHPTMKAAARELRRNSQ